MSTKPRRRKPSEPWRQNVVLALVRKQRGTAPRIAAVCGITREAVWLWPQVPAKHVLAVEQLLEIPRHLIRSDIYPPPYHYRTKRWLNSNGRKQHGGRA